MFDTLELAGPEISKSSISLTFFCDLSIRQLMETGPPSLATARQNTVNLCGEEKVKTWENFYWNSSPTLGERAHLYSRMALTVISALIIAVFAFDFRKGSKVTYGVFGITTTIFLGGMLLDFFSGSRKEPANKECDYLSVHDPERTPERLRGKGCSDQEIQAWQKYNNDSNESANWMFMLQSWNQYLWISIFPALLFDQESNTSLTLYVIVALIFVSVFPTIWTSFRSPPYEDDKCNTGPNF